MWNAEFISYKYEIFYHSNGFLLGLMYYIIHYTLYSIQAILI